MTDDDILTQTTCPLSDLKPLPRFVRWVTRRKPDFVIGDPSRPYMRRWWVIPRNPIFNIYLHNILRDDDDRALHDHPWLNLSIVLAGGYFDVTADRGGHLHKKWVAPGSIKFRSPWTAHRLVAPSPAWSLFITGPKMRVWGFFCPKGWVPWHRFVSTHNAGEVGPGCGD